MKAISNYFKLVALLSITCYFTACNTSKDLAVNENSSATTKKSRNSRATEEETSTINSLSLVERLRHFSGVSVTGSAENPVVLIRGINTFVAGTEPLLVINGSPYGGTLGEANNFINGNQIKAIKVLKDPADVAIYGVRGGNGIIEIALK